MSSPEIHPIFGRVVAEWSSPPPQTTSSEPFLFHVLSSRNDRSAIRVIATDFHSNTFQVIKTRQQLEDLRDDIGIGGSWSEFIDYVTASLNFGDVKLVISGASESGDGACAKLIAQKAKGMPRILFSLAKVVGSAASEAIANLTLDLYKEFKDVQSSLVEDMRLSLQWTKTGSSALLVNILVSRHEAKLTMDKDRIFIIQIIISNSGSSRDRSEQESKSQLKKVLAAEQEKSITLQKQLDTMLFPKKHKFQKINDRRDSDSTSVSQDSPEKQAVCDPNSRKGTNRVVPAHRRSKVRGAILDDTEDE